MSKVRRLLLLVPGFQEEFADGSQLAILKNHLKLESNAEVTRIARQTFSGYVLETSDAAIELFEIDWQASTQLLSSKNLIERLIRGIVVLWAWVVSRKPSRSHRGWYGWFAAFLVMMGLWSLATLAAMGQTVTKIFHLWGSQLDLVTDLWVLLTLLLAALGLSINATVDVAELFQRYLGNLRDESGLRTREVMRAAVVEGINSFDLDDYDDVVIVAHSFGVLVAMDSIAEKLTHPVSLVSLGGFLGFLATENNWVNKRIKRCLASPSLAYWTDYYSNQDVFAAPSPLQRNGPKSTSDQINLDATRWQSVTGAAHSMYFQNETVKRCLLNAKPIRDGA